MKVMKIYIKRQLLLSLKGSLGITSGKVFAREKKKDRCTGVTWPLEDKSVQFSSATQSCPTLCDPMDCSTPGLPVPHQLLEFTQTLAHWVGDDIQPSHPLSSLSPPVFNLSQHQCLFQGVSSSHQVAKYWSFSFSLSPSNDFSGLISFRINWLDLLAVQGTLMSLLQHHNSKTSIFQYSAFFMVQLSHTQILLEKP